MWLKNLAAELVSENQSKRHFLIVFIRNLCRTECVYEGLSIPIPLSADIADRLLIARLELDPHAMTYVLHSPTYELDLGCL